MLVVIEITITMSNKLSINDFFETTDLGLACVLVSLGFPVDCLDRSDPSRTKFLFQRDKNLDKAAQAFWAKTLKIEPQRILANLKMLKNRLYNER